MSSARETYFTKVDEAAFSRELRAKYPDIRFAEDLNKVESASDIIFLDAIDTATCSVVEFFVPDPDWHPEFGPARFGNGQVIVNLPELHGSINRSSNGWRPSELGQDGEPRWITVGKVIIYYHPPANKAEKSFRDTVWRMFPKIGTWELQPYQDKPRRKADWKKTDKRIWAGTDATRWAKAHPMRTFSGGQFLYRPVNN